MIEYYKGILRSYDTAYINTETRVVRMENYKGWFMELTLSPELAYCLLDLKLTIIYEEENI